MTYYLPEFLTIAFIHLLAVMSPGPDFILISKNSLVYSRRAGIFSALGLALGILVHVTYCLVGIGYIISKSIVLFSLLKFLGAGYLIFIGYQSLKAKPTPAAVSSDAKKEQAIGKGQAIKVGFLTNILNPKVTLFFLALFTQVIHPTTPLFIKIIYGLEMSLMTFLWFSFVSCLLSHPKIQGRMLGVQHWVERAMGAALIALGIKVALAKAK